MNRDLARLIALLFDKDDRVCVSDSKFASHSVEISAVLSDRVTLVSPNPSVPIKEVGTDKIIMLAINAMGHGYRNDSNVTKFRSFLWEIDVGTIPDQIAWVKQLGIPTSACIFSGNKSAHFVTALREPLRNEEIYRMLYQWGLNIGTLFDPACKNPSRSVRVPGVIRPDTDRRQELIELGGRVDIKDFASWLGRHPEAKPRPEEKRQPAGEFDFGKLPEWVIYRLKHGLDPTKGRNRQWYGISTAFLLSGFSLDGTIEILLQYFVEEKDFTKREFLTTIKSAFNRVTS
jgi:hypothetical protein